MTEYRPGSGIVYTSGARVYKPRASGAVNWWEAGGAAGAIAVYQPISAASYAASKSNLANPGTYDATEGVAPTWAALTGWTFNGAQGLGTGLAATNAMSWAIRFAGATADNAALFGQSDANVRVNFYPNFVGRHYFRAGGSYNRAVPGGWQAAVAAATPDAAYWNGASVGAIVGPLVGATAATIGIGNTLFSGPWTGQIVALAVYGGTLTAPQVAAVAAAMALL